MVKSNVKLLKGPEDKDGKTDEEKFRRNFNLEKQVSVRDSFARPICLK